MNPIDIPFDAENLVTSIEAVASRLKSGNKSPLRSTQVAVFPPAPPMGPRAIQKLRRALGVSQVAFASMLNVPVVTAVSWEKGRRSPSGAALRLLELARKHPEVLAAKPKGSVPAF